MPIQSEGNDFHRVPGDEVNPHKEKQDGEREDKGRVSEGYPRDLYLFCIRVLLQGRLVNICILENQHNNEHEECVREKRKGCVTLSAHTE